MVQESLRRRIIKKKISEVTGYIGITQKFVINCLPEQK